MSEINYDRKTYVAGSLPVIDKVVDLNAREAAIQSLADDHDKETAVGRTLVEAENVTAQRTALSINNVDNTADADKPVSTAQAAALALKVDKVTGYALSKNDFSDAAMSKLSGIEAGADVTDEVNVTAIANATAEVTAAPAHWWVLVGGALKRMTHAGWLTLVRAACGIAHLDTGGTLMLGATPKTLTVNADAETANIPTATGKANADGATATPTAAKVPIADASGLLDSWVSDASTTKKGKVLLPNPSGFAPMPLDADVVIGPSTTGLTVGKKGIYRSDGAFTLPAAGTWEYYIEQMAMPVVQKAPGITKTLYGTEAIKHLGGNYFVATTSNTYQVIIYSWANEALTQIAAYTGPGTTGIAILQEWNGSTARLALITGDGSTTTIYVLVFDGTTITLESTNSLGIGLLKHYISGTALTATRIALIGGYSGTNKNTLYACDYDTTAKTWALVGTPLPLTVQYRCGMCKAWGSTTDIILTISAYSVARYSFDGSAWSLIGTAYSLYTNHGLSGNNLFCLPLENNRYLVGFLNSSSPTTGIVLWWNSTNLVFRPISAVLKLRSTSASYSAWGYGLGTLLSFDANEGKVYPYQFPAGELTTRFAGVNAGGTTIAPAEIATAYCGSMIRIQ